MFISSFKSRIVTGGAGLAIAGSALALAVTPSTVTASSVSSSAIYYQVNPIAKLALSTPGATPGGFPFLPSQCVAKFGLACYTPQDLKTAYNFPSNYTGTGETIVIIDAYGSPTIAADLATYDQEFGLPAPPHFNIIYPTGSPVFNPLQNHSEISWAEETSLDVEQSHGLAPGATIDLVVAANNSGNVLNNAEQYAVNNHLGQVMSMSFGAPEALFQGNNDQLTQAEAIYQQAVGQGMSIFASAGDTGATEGTSSSSALFPASSPLVTSVGGTDLFLSNQGHYKSETTWNDSIPALCPFGCDYGPFGATGGAPSVYFYQPGYQAGDGSGAMRTTSDVSFNASVYTATMIYLGFLGGSNNGFYFFGGTSEGSPSWAAITALADQAAGKSLGELNPLLYGIYGSNSRTYAADFHNIYGSGQDNAFDSTIGYLATGPGYNLPTGLGTPNVANLISSLAKGL